MLNYKPHNAHVNAEVYEVVEQLFKKGREPRTFGCCSFHTLQLRPHPSEPADYPGDGCGCHTTTMVADRHGTGNADLASLRIAGKRPYIGGTNEHDWRYQARVSSDWIPAAGGNRAPP